MNTLFCFVGESGSGKTTIITELNKQFPKDFKIMKSVTTRRRRDETDDLFYDLLTQDQFSSLREQGELIEEIEYAGNRYALNADKFFQTLHDFPAMLAITEEGASKIRKYHKDIFIISVLPLDKELCKTKIREPEKERSEADKNRSLTKSGLVPNYILINSFSEGGLQDAIDEIAGVMFRKTRQMKLYVE